MSRYLTLRYFTLLCSTLLDFILLTLLNLTLHCFTILNLHFYSTSTSLYTLRQFIFIYFTGGPGECGAKTVQNQRHGSDSLPFKFVDAITKRVQTQRHQAEMQQINFRNASLPPFKTRIQHKGANVDHANSSKSIAETESNCAKPPGPE